MQRSLRGLRLLIPLVKTLHQSIVPITRKQPRYFVSIPNYIFNKLTSLPRFQSTFTLIMEREADILETHSTAKRKKNNRSQNSRRFSDEQIKLLESIFEADSKLEPRRKVQVARELGLQPRQVAIWFQNRRARWKSKQIEQDFRTLRNEYDLLASKFESLKEEKQSLLIQLEKLNDMRKPKAHDADTDGKDLEGSSSKDANGESTEEKPSDLQLQSHKNIASNEVEDGGHEQLMNMCQVEAIVSPEDWHRFDSGGLFGASRSSSATSQWFNFWIN